MQCEEFESRLNDLLDERRNPLDDATLAAHWNVCSPCAALVRGQDALLEGVAAWKKVEPSADLTERVIRQWESIQAQPGYGQSTEWDSAELPSLLPIGLVKAERSGGFWSDRRNQLMAGAAFATAAVLMVVASLDSFRKPGDRVPVALRTPAEQSVPMAGASKIVAGPNVKTAGNPQGMASQITFASLPLVEQVTETYRPLLEETDRTFRKSLGWLPIPAGSQWLTQDVVSGTIKATDPLRDNSNLAQRKPAEDASWDAFAPEQVAPLTHNAVRSVVALLRVLPGVEQPTHQ